MSLKKYAGSDINQISDTLQKYLDERKLKPGGLVKYRLLIGHLNIDRERQKGDDILFPSSVVIHFRDRIFDPGDEGQNNARDVEIGAVQSFNDVTKQPTFKFRLLSPTKGDGGEFMVRHGNIDEMESYECLELHNGNGANPFRDTSNPPIFERVNDIAESEVRSKKRNYLYDSLTAIRVMTYSEMQVFGAGYNLSTKLPLEVLKEKLEAIAEKDPKTFYDAIDGPDLKVKAIIKMATEAEIIAYSAHENKWTYVGSNEVIVALDRKEGASYIDQFAAFLMNSSNGDKVKASLIKLLEKKKTGK